MSDFGSQTATDAVPHSTLMVRTRILRHSEPDKSGCRNWTGYVNPEGYGRIKVAGTTHNAHRIAYLVFVGPFDLDLQIDHLCRNRRCVEPAHLEPVTNRENQRRGPGRFTHCQHGHLLAGDNLAIRKDGGRKCRACHRRMALASYYRLRGASTSSATGATGDDTTDMAAR